MTAGLLIAALLLRDARPPRTAVVLIALWGAAVGLTRVYLGVHWFSDVIGGWLFATAWLALLACAYLRRTGARLPGSGQAGVKMCSGASSRMNPLSKRTRTVARSRCSW